MAISSTNHNISLVPASRDRLFFSFFVVCLVHALLIFGVRFVAQPPSIAATPPAIEIAINQANNQIIPDEADYLGRESSSGGDPEILEKVRRSDLFTTVSTQQDLGVSPISQEQLNAQRPTAHSPDVLTVWASEHRVHSQSETEPEKETETINSVIDRESLQMANLTQELRTLREKYSKQSKELTLNSNTREYIAAEYIRDWIRLVESVGNTNLPSSADNMTGAVILEVNINSQGTLIGSRILRSSGHVPLDEAALMSVKLASPFKAFTPKLREKADILNIVRTWQYENNRLSTISAN